MTRRLLALGSAALLAGCAGTATSVDGVGACRRDADQRDTDGGPSAARFRYEQRLDEHGGIPEGAILRAIEQRRAMHAAPLWNAGDLAWTWLGPGNIGGRIRGILVHPTTPTTMWAGAATGGVWKTTNGGTSWSALNDFVPALSIGCLTMDPADPNVIYAGTGEGYFDTVEGSSNTAAVRGGGIFRTPDGGTTWAQLPSTANPDFNFVNRIALSPLAPGLMLAATNTGIFRSTDSGSTFQQVSTGQTFQVLFHPSDATRLVAGRNDGTARYSIDGGLTWAPATGLAGTRVELRYAPSSPTTVYAAVSDAVNLKIYRSLDGGQTYALQTTGAGVQTLESYTGVLWIDPLNPSSLIVGGVNLWRSTNAGATLTSGFGSTHSDNHIIVQHPAYDGTTNRTLFFGTDGGVFRATDSATNTVTSLNNNLGITQFYGASVNPNGIVLAGAQDNFSLRYSGNPQAWTQTLGGDGGFTTSDPTNANYMYCEYQRLAIHRSTNAGVGVSIINNGLTDWNSLNCNFIPYYTLDPNNPNVMLAGGRRLWRSTNVKAATASSVAWSVIKASIEPPAPPPPPWDPPNDHFTENSPYNISTIAIAQGNSDLVWVGYNNGQVWKSTDATAVTPAWTRMDQSGPLPARWPQNIRIDPTNASRVYVSFLGYATGNVWKTEDGGASWQNVSGSGSGALPAIPVSGLALHPQAFGRLYAGTDVGMFLTTNDGASWSPVDTGSGGPGMAPEEQLFFRDATTLVVVTHGRGIYTVSVPVPPCYANCDGSTTLPVLNVADFTCFLQKFAASDPYANCDGSTNPPVLNVADFTCFLQQFAAGCP